MGISTAETKPELTKYELLNQIGHGGMATVYRARDRRLGRDVAVKVIHPHLRGSAEVAARFVSEARAVAMLKHENIVEVYDISDENDAERYLVVELVSGPTLRRLLSEHGALPAEVAVAIALQVAGALTHAHEQSVIHRDVKPENVLIAPPRAGASGRDERARTVVKLTDFGIAKLLDAHGITSTGQVLGSPAHMAPEQIEGGDVGARADVFGLGVLLYECMVGRLPFDGKNPAQVLRCVLEGDHPVAERERPEVGAQWSRILDKALMKDQAERYASIEAFSAAIREELARLDVNDPNDELDRFISDPGKYAAAYPQFIADRLVRAGEEARRKGDMLVASSEFNRALSLRPGDRELLQRVSALARRSQMLRAARIGGMALGATALVGITAFALSRKSDPAITADASAEPPAVISARVSPLPSVRPTTVRSAAPAPSVSARDSARDESSTPTAWKRQAPAPLSSPEITERLVAVRVVGVPKGGEVVIDGVAQSNWIAGTPYKLSVGKEHAFEFRFTDASCCQATTVKRIIEAGQEPLEVVVNTSFKDAQLRVTGPAGLLKCPSLFGPHMSVPGKQFIRMSSPEASDRCTYDPEDQNSPRNPRVEVNLRPGQITALQVP